MSSKEVKKWADSFMFEAEEIDESTGPEVFLISCNNDPLGSIAAAAKAYVGEFVSSLAEITDAERRHYLGEIQKTALAMPLEAVNLHFRIKGVTRGFTHQMVRQRTAAYSQESTRFAVKTGVPVGLPPSLDGTKSREQWLESEWDSPGQIIPLDEMTDGDFDAYIERYASEQQRWRFKWDEMVSHIEVGYNELVNSGMPAEDARGILPTNLLTQLNYFTSLRGLHDHAGLRLCTQAQHEWKVVWAQILDAIVKYGATQKYQMTLSGEDFASGGWDFDARPGDVVTVSSAWQFQELARIFKPKCYYDGHCTFKADFDRKCNIRERVDANAAINRPSSEWHESVMVSEQNAVTTELGFPMIPAILPSDWTRADAAR